jgi:hypothetical protein
MVKNIYFYDPNGAAHHVWIFTPLAAVDKYSIPHPLRRLAHIPNPFSSLNCLKQLVVDPTVTPGLAAVLLMVDHNI